MTKQNFQTAMDQRIFERGLAVETVSVYLMLTGLTDVGETLTDETLRAVWSGKTEDLAKGIEILREQGIVDASGNGGSCYLLRSFEFWKKT